MITLFLNDLKSRLDKLPEFRRLEAAWTKGAFPLELAGLDGSFFACCFAFLYKKRPRPACLVFPTEQEAENFARDCVLFGAPAAVFPWWGTIAYKDHPPAASVQGRRMAILSELAIGRPRVIATSLRAFLTPVAPPEAMRQLILALRKGERIDPGRIGSRLAELGYLRVPRVGLAGEFAIRGEVIDIAPHGLDKGALRLVFEFDKIEDIRFFEPATQASLGRADEALIYPAKECLWTEERLRALAERMSALPEFRDRSDLALGELESSGRLAFEELLYPLSFERPCPFMSYWPADSVTILAGRERLASGTEALRREFEGLYHRARLEHPVPKPEHVLMDLEAILDDGRGKMVLTALNPGQAAFRIKADAPRSFFGNLGFLKEELSALELAGYSIYVFSDSDVQRQRLEVILADRKLAIIPSTISAGFSAPDLKIMVIHENEIFGRRRRRPASVKTARSQALDTFVELAPGDCVVHVQHGIGRFLGIKRMRAMGNERDYIQLEYADQESVFVPVEQVNLVQRYIGHEGGEPRLDKLGGKSWENRKTRVKKSVEDLAQRLVALYSKRKKVRGHAFPRDTEWQLEFEAAFPFEETEDQLKCIEDVKADMEKPVPMDRLICGDVGYGKTEVAVRAAFKAVADGKQVAILAPTTILTEQHFENISDRVRRYPVRTAMLSRFVPRAEQRKVLAGLAAGEVDLVVGTHRLLQKDVKFRDLGLMVVDEEQRFGVKDKERLKEFKTSVDCLALTATPIPRTLHMSLLKIRDMSILNTPPANRLPIETHIEHFSEELVARAIRREIARGGQVFFLHNRIESLEEVQLMLRRAVPEVMVKTAHGRMAGEELEDLMHSFVHGGFQVLVSTTIIENGIDIPNVNTIIIDRADMYGISQLYQLRGRVGRSGRRAYAYLLYPGERALSELAMKRLRIVSDHTDLGSGFKIALKDLEVRGAGNLLGREQSGEIASVGFDLYLRLLDEALRALGEEGGEAGPPETYLELEYSGFIPDGYIDEPVEKMAVYKKIASIVSDAELESVHAELLDRFGPLPEELESLLSLAEIRIMCGKLLIGSLRERGGLVEVEFSRVAGVSAQRVVALINDSKGRVRLDPRRPQVLVIQTGSVGLREKSEFIRDRLSRLL